jgi:fermentation-respiration switch protein FrsA (DUF1100 family)
VLVVHGEKDPVVPITLGAQLYGLIQAPKRFVRVAGGGTAQSLAKYDHVGFYVRAERGPTNKSPLMSYSDTMRFRP